MGNQELHKSKIFIRQTMFIHDSNWGKKKEEIKTTHIQMGS